MDDSAGEGGAANPNTGERHASGKAGEKGVKENLPAAVSMSQNKSERNGETLT